MNNEITLTRAELLYILDTILESRDGDRLTDRQENAVSIIDGYLYGN